MREAPRLPRGPPGGGGRQLPGAIDELLGAGAAAAFVAPRLLLLLLLLVRRCEFVAARGRARVVLMLRPLASSHISLPLLPPSPLLRSSPNKQEASPLLYYENGCETVEKEKKGRKVEMTVDRAASPSPVFCAPISNGIFDGTAQPEKITSLTPSSSSL